MSDDADDFDDYKKTWEVSFPTTDRNAITALNAIQAEQIIRVLAENDVPAKMIGYYHDKETQSVVDVFEEKKTISLVKEKSKEGDA